jgi:HK97 family phage prohead protease
VGRKINRVLPSQFKAAAERFERDKLDEQGFAICKSLVAEVKQVGPAEDRIREFRASDGTVDRDKDTLAVDGWELDNAIKSGAFLWAHNGSVPPIAKFTALFVEGDALKARVEFTPPDMKHPLGDGFGNTVMRMYDEGFLRAVSVGFIPIEWTINEDRGGFLPMDFKRQELLEVSAVPIPANPNALIEARGVGIDIDPLVAWAEMERDASSGLWAKQLDGLLGTTVSSTTFTLSTDSGTTEAEAWDDDDLDDEPGATAADDVEAEAAEETDEEDTADEGELDIEAELERCIDAAQRAEAKVAKSVLAGAKILAKHGRPLSDATEKMLTDARDLIDAALGSTNDKATEVVVAVVDDPDDLDPDDPQRPVTYEEFRKMAKSFADKLLTKTTGALPD